MQNPAADRRLLDTLAMLSPGNGQENRSAAAKITVLRPWSTGRRNSVSRYVRNGGLAQARARHTQARRRVL